MSGIARRGYNVPVAEFSLRSEAFEDGEPIPRRYTCEGEDVSPALEWSGVPPETRSLALVVDDPDAPRGTFTHWLAWGLDPAAGRLEESESAPVEGRNDMREVGWSGPCPPPGHGPHRYFFRLHALDRELELPGGAGRSDFDRALTAPIATAELVGTYER